jgi:hypothetical protein
MIVAVGKSKNRETLTSIQKVKSRIRKRRRALGRGLPNLYTGPGPT